jgi:hypothetical protein
MEVVRRVMKIVWRSRILHFDDGNEMQGGNSPTIKISHPFSIDPCHAVNHQR